MKCSASAGSQSTHKEHVLVLPAEKDRTLAKIGAILKELNLSWNYAHGMAKAMFARERVEWLDAAELHKLMQALAVYQRRQRVRRAQAQEAK